MKKKCEPGPFNLFKLAQASHSTVTWPKEIDFDPDTLYLESRPAKLEEQAA